MKKQTIMGKHSKRVCAGAWHSENLFATGSDDKTVCLSNEDGDALEGTDSEPLRLKNDPSMMQFADLKGDTSGREKVVSIVLGEVTLLLCNLKDPQKPTELAFQPLSPTNDIVFYSFRGLEWLGRQRSGSPTQAQVWHHQVVCLVWGWLPSGGLLSRLHRDHQLANAGDVGGLSRLRKHLLVRS